MADLVTPPPTRRGTKRSYRDTSAYKQEAARDLQAVFDLPESPPSSKAARGISKGALASRPSAARSLSSSSARGKTPVRQMAARTSTTSTSRARLAKAMNAAAEADLRSSQAARALRATLPVVPRRGGGGSGGRSAQKTELRHFLMTTVPSLQAASSVDEVGATTLKECVRASQLARVNFASEFKHALAAAHAGINGTELQQNLQVVRRSGNAEGCHKLIKVSFPSTRGAFLRLFGERVSSPCTAFGQFTRLATSHRAALLVNAGVADDDDPSLDDPKRDWRAEWDMVADTLPASAKVQPVITLGSFKAPLKAALQLDYLVDKDMLLDAMLPRAAGKWTLGRFMSVGGTMDVFAELCTSAQANVAFTPSTQDATSCIASIRTTFAGMPSERGGVTRSTPVCRDFLKARGTVTVTVPLRYETGPAAK